MIRFNIRVGYVGMLDYGVCSNDLKWVVRSVDKKSEKTVEEVFNEVVIATGHYSQPRLPSIQGKMDTWKRKQMHSHIYRTPEPFRNEVAGWTQVYGNMLSYATIRGASHEAPFTQPRISLVLLKAFLEGKPLLGVK
ncbi:hypothetical protein JHK85_006676 [Glycine max]|nr:hypothetical protein JHK85_006676 [Glycine max]